MPAVDSAAIAWPQIHSRHHRPPRACRTRSHTCSRILSCRGSKRSRSPLISSLKTSNKSSPSRHLCLSSHLCRLPRLPPTGRFPTISTCTLWPRSTDTRRCVRRSRLSWARWMRAKARRRRRRRRRQPQIRLRRRLCRRHHQHHQHHHHHRRHQQHQCRPRKTKAPQKRFRRPASRAAITLRLRRRPFCSSH